MRSTITCDMEGVIETMNDGAEKIFGYKKEELIGKKRVSIFSPGEIVLQNVAGWLDTAVKEGEYKGETYFLNKKGEKINAQIRITPTFANGKDKPQTGYCGVTEVIEKDVQVPINFSTKLVKGLAITRMPFTSASLLPVFVIGAYFAGIGDDLFNTSLFVLTIFGILIAHLGINVFNDYFDVKDGTDEENAEYFQQVSGGSRAIELGLISLAGTRKLAIILTLIALAIGAYILTNVNPANMDGVWQILVAGLLLGYFYTARPLRLVARRGLGEIAIFLAFGPLLTLGTGLAIFNGDFGNSEHFLNCMLIGIPMGLLTTNILLINEFPDMKSDAKTGKNHLVVTFGKKASRWIYLLFLTLAVASSFYMYQTIANQYLLIPTIFCLLFGLYIFRHILKHYEMRSLVDANWKTIGLQALYSILLCICLLFGF
jgi:1,4-dihydroxy-2-naphthoate octaprenyltransferase